MNGLDLSVRLCGAAVSAARFQTSQCAGETPAPQGNLWPNLRKSVRTSWILLAFAPAVLILTAPSTTEAAEGPLIVSARVEAIGPVDEEGILEVLELQKGNRIDRQRLRELILTLYAGAEVERMRVITAETEGGVDVVVRMSNRSTVSGVKVRTGKPTRRVKSSALGADRGRRPGDG